MRRSKYQVINNFTSPYPPASDLGVFVLINQNPTPIEITATDGTTITLDNVGELGDGSMVRFLTTGTLPTGVVTGQSYWIRLLGGTDVLVYPTPEDFLNDSNAIPIDLGTGSGVHSLIEQTITEDLFAKGHIFLGALLAKELSHPDYTRKILNYPAYQWDEATATVSLNHTLEYNVTSPMTFKFILFLREGTETIGGTIGTADLLIDAKSVQTVTNTQFYKLSWGANA